MQAPKRAARPGGPPEPGQARPNSHSLLGWAGPVNIARRAGRAEIYAGLPGPN